MPTYTWIEDNSSRGATIHRLGRKATSTYRKSWKIFGSTDDSAVHADVNQTLWQSYMFWEFPGQPQNRLQAESYTLEYLGDQAWQLEVSYSKEGGESEEQRDPMKRSRSFDTGGGTQHVTQAIGSDAFPNGEQRFHTGSPAAPNMFGAIGVDGDSVNGVDIIIPQLTWTESYDVPNQYVSTNYIKTVSSLTGTVNNAAFRTFAAGEVLFAGASGSQQWDSDKGDGPWNLSYKFIASPNQGSGKTLPAITVGAVTNVEKDGHDYLWVRYEDSVANDTLFKQPKFVYVNKVYRRADFSQLGLGVS
jgi:hypothetical protein